MDAPKILIAEDDPGFIPLLKKFLSELEAEIIVARDGNEAYQLASLEAPQLIISDWMMPGLNGEELCQKIKAHDKLKTIYFIMLTSRDQTEDLVTSLRSGADDYITKPPKPQELIARVQTGLRLVHLQQELTELQKIESIRETAITANHEINNPLQAIFMNVELLLVKNPDLDEWTRKALQKIIEAAERIRNVTHQMSTIIKSTSSEYTPGGPTIIDLKQSEFD
ncbi:MAG: response regulator [Candidatus Neomarinimicrobiota bacterium]|nr:MAG: response regulator [Candidatus Neomarinimicrobiota bacterium]